MASVEVEYKVPGQPNRLLPEGMGEQLGYKRADSKPVPTELTKPATGKAAKPATAEATATVDAGTSTPTGQQ